jgi:hypothetical protein
MALQVSGANHRWRWQFRCSGSRRKSAVIQLSTLGNTMNIAIELAAFWGVAFLRLCVAVVLLSVFSGIIESDMESFSYGKEAGIASQTVGMVIFIFGLRSIVEN